MSTYNTSDPEFTAIGPGLNAWNMKSRNWLDESRVWKSTGKSVDETITLRPHVRRDLAGFLAAELGEYLIEFRVGDGWDGGIPRPAILVHRFEAGHSYLMRGNSGSFDLIAGDSFGDDVPEPGPMSMFGSFKRVDVLSIDGSDQRATIRLRYHQPFSIALGLAGLAVDPMYLILSGSAYLRWVEQHHPHELKVADIEATLRTMTSEELNAALRRANILMEYGMAGQEASARLKK